MKELNTMVSTSQGVKNNDVIVTKNGKKADNGKLRNWVLYNFKHIELQKQLQDILMGK